MNNARRLGVYIRGKYKPLDKDGFYRITPRQRRRLNKKARKHDYPSYGINNVSS